MELTDLDERRRASLNKVRGAWESIIKRYSALSATQQGDVVDIATGEIIEDTGHLRSLRQSGDNLWAAAPTLAARGAVDDDNDEFTGNVDAANGGIGPRRKSKATGRSKTIEIIDLESPSRRRGRQEPFHSQPGDTSYIVSSSQHMTRSKVVGDDNLIVGGLREYRSRPQDGTDANMSYLQRRRPTSKRSGLLDSTSNDPLNMLSPYIDLGTPSKVRRLRKALDHAYKGKRNESRRHLHKLVLQEKLGSK